MMISLSHHHHSVFLLLAVCSLFLQLMVVVTAQDGTTCDASLYYSTLDASVSNWDKTDVAALVTRTHTTVLPVVAPFPGQDDVYLALMDLWPGGESNDTTTTVHLIYRDISFPAVPYDNTNTWDRADLWPLERGIPRSTDGHTDVHSKAPADSTVLNRQGALFFGECGTVELLDICIQPEEVAQDCFTDDKIWMPPANVRGDIARALFYSQLRYENELDLQLVDCPPFVDGEFGYLSQLLQWHQDDPVDDVELARNNRICSRWQGNRNPFIDFPQLVEQYYGSPDSIREGTYMYSQCTVETSAPTATPNDCTSLEPGDVQILMVNSDAPDQIAFFTLDIVPYGVRQLYVTDKPWDGSQFVENGEGTLVISVPRSTIGGDNATYSGFAPGSIFSIGFPADTNTWSTYGPGDFDVNADGQGDVLFTYCLNADGLPHFLNAFAFHNQPDNTATAWANAGLTAEDYGESTSALPLALTEQGFVALPLFKNHYYAGPTEMFKQELVQAFMNASYYMGENDVRGTVPSLETSQAVRTTSKSLLFLLTGSIAVLTSSWMLLLG